MNISACCSILVGSSTYGHSCRNNFCGLINGQVKVIDFGSSCFVDDCLTNYVQSRSYRCCMVLARILWTAHKC